MEMSLSWETADTSATQEFPNILYNTKHHYDIQKSLPLVSILAQMNPAHTTPSYSSKIHFNV
jgi:hypothetical protein